MAFLTSRIESIHGNWKSYDAPRDTCSLLNEISLRFQIGIDMLNPSKGDVILDLGCGEFAVLEKSIACFCDEILALDINPQALMKAKSNSLFNVHFIGASVAALPFKSKCVNKIAALELIEHLSKEIEGSFFKEAKLVLKESGYLVISTPNDSNVLINLLDPH